MPVAKKTIRDVDTAGKRILVRVDFNVPLDHTTHTISVDNRIRACLPTLRYLLERKARVVLCSHLGRPKGRPDPQYSLFPVAHRLSQLMGVPVQFAGDCTGPEAQRATAALEPGGVLLLENLRFHPEEEKNDSSFARALSALGEVYVNDAFGVAHRSHASVVGVAHYLPAVAGLLLEKELEFLGRALDHPVKPMAAVLGGAKVSDKLGVVENLLRRVDYLMIGGGMAATFLKARGYQVGQSPVEEDRLPSISSLERHGEGNGVQLLLPLDVVVAETVEPQAVSRTVPVSEVPAQWYIVDVGPRTIAMFSSYLRRCKTVVWNGPMGVFEMPAFAAGTRALAETLARLDATTIVGGGSTAEAVHKLSLEEKMTHVSTGGGASLMFLEGKTLPGVAALLDR